ncbi:MAG: hypothetical protein K940chlam6_00789 [Chlamydiae bacterium]|nr:hypothetical protein [Chlamydiota bacterium]
MVDIAVKSSSLADWIKPGPFSTDVKKYVSERENAKDALEGVINIFDWMAHLGYSKEFAEAASGQLDPIKKTLAIPGFVEALGDMRDKWHILNNSDDQDAFTNLTTSTAVATLNLSESAMAVDAWGIYPLKEGLKAAKTGFWASAGLLDGISFFRELSKAEHLRKKVDGVIDPELKNIYQHRIQLCYLNVLKATTTLAMASIALISLLFASLAHGFLFSPVVFLTLCSAWLILTYTTYFYGKMIDRWENDLPTGMV